MKLLPITIAAPTIAPLTSGRVKRLRLPPVGDLAKVQAGDVLWIREPFAFNARWDAFSPARAIADGAVPHFTGTLIRGGPAMLGLGKPRGAVSLPFAGHRQHLVVTAIVREPLQAITEGEMRAEGFAGRNAWVEAWDRGVARQHPSNGASFTWSANPEIPVIDIALQKRPAQVGQP